MNFFDNFQAIDTYIQHSPKLSKFVESPRFQKFQPSELNPDFSLPKLLLNCWSAEYALRITPIVNDEQYLQSSLHWTFPQAYYSVYFSCRSFLMLHGITANSEEVVRQKIGALVQKGYYPSSFNFYATGSECLLNRLDVVEFPEEKTVDKEMACYLMIADFLVETRKRQKKTLFEKIQCNPKTAIRNTRTGTIAKTIGQDAARILSQQIGVTSFFDLIARLRISNTNRDVEHNYGKIVDVRALHKCFSSIVAHINLVHELYIAKAIGINEYLTMVGKLPSYLGDGFVGERATTQIVPLLKSVGHELVV